mmetsp:Transcript_23414/g.63479  ORF Transcript_23414/g.63479 Transcript_23414/m.63479 type:complete len:348 (-) Transcript_23414:93-1136(-)
MDVLQRLALLVGIQPFFWQSTEAVHDIKFFTPVFRQRHSMPTLFQEKLQRLSIASAVNLPGAYVVVTHASYPELKGLRRLVSQLHHARLQVHEDSEVLADTPLEIGLRNWVWFVERLKLVFIQTQAPGSRLVYVEIDQLFLPLAHSGFQRAFQNETWDVGYTFLTTAPQGFGYINTGVVLLTASLPVVSLFQRIANETWHLTHGRVAAGLSAKGGENQIALSKAGIPHLRVGELLDLVIGPGQDNGLDAIHIRIKAFEYGGPLNSNSNGCCHLKQGTYVAHFKSLKKAWILDSCCRDAVGVKAAPEWRETCTCTQRTMDKPPTCAPSDHFSANLSGIASWCSYSRAV